MLRYVFHVIIQSLLDEILKTLVMSLRRFGSGLSLISELESLQRDGDMCDTRLVCDGGSVAVHWPLLEMKGVWWAGLGRHASLLETVVILPGVNINQLNKFVSELYSFSEVKGEPIKIRIKPDMILNGFDEEDNLNNDEGYEVEKYETDVKNEYLDNGDNDYHESDDEDADADEDYEYKGKYEGEEKERLLELVEEENYQTLSDITFKKLRSKYPPCIKIDREILNQSMENIGVKLLNVKYKSGSEEKRNQRQKVFECKQCGDERNFFDKAFKHSTSHFDKIYHCEECDKHLKFGVDFHLKKQHSEAHKATKINICDLCGRNCRTKRHLELHMKSHEQKFCDMCDYQCESRQTLLKHISRKHPDPTKEKEQYPCHICGKVFLTSTYLKDHIAIHGDAIHKCNQCDRSFKTPKNLKNHIIRDHEEKKHVCEECGQKFAFKHKLIQHFTTFHTDLKEFACKQCDYKGATNKLLYSHMAVHKLPKYSCDFCGKKFRQNSSMRAHRMTHTGEKPYGCRECTFRCIQPNELTKHYAKTHQMTIKNPISFIQKRV